MDDHLLGGLDGAGALAVAVPAVWAGWWMLAQRPKPLPEEVVMEKQGKIHIVTEEVFL